MGQRRSRLGTRAQAVRHDGLHRAPRDHRRRTHLDFVARARRARHRGAGQPQRGAWLDPVSRAVRELPRRLAVRPGACLQPTTADARGRVLLPKRSSMWRRRTAPRCGSPRAIATAAPAAPTTVDRMRLGSPSWQRLPKHPASRFPSLLLQGDDAVRGEHPERCRSRRVGSFRSHAITARTWTEIADPAARALHDGYRAADAVRGARGRLRRAVSEHRRIEGRVESRPIVARPSARGCCSTQARSRRGLPKTSRSPTPTRNGYGALTTNDGGVTWHATLRPILCPDLCHDLPPSIGWEDATMPVRVVQHRLDVDDQRRGRHVDGVHCYSFRCTPTSAAADTAAEEPCRRSVVWLCRSHRGPRWEPACV